MRRFNSFLSLSIVLVIFLFPFEGLAEQNSGSSGPLYDCGTRNCGAWKGKGENTCRTCTTPQCRKRGGKEILVGKKTETECYGGHGPPPRQTQPQSSFSPWQKTPSAPAGTMKEPASPPPPSFQAPAQRYQYTQPRVYRRGIDPLPPAVTPDPEPPAEPVIR